MSGIFVFSWLAFAVVVGVAANARGRSWFGWFLIAILLSPLLALILVLVMKKIEPPVDVSSDVPINTSGTPKNKTFYEGERNLNADGYKLYLVKAFQITKNDVLGQFVVGEQLFHTLEESLIKADQLDREVQEVAKRREEVAQTGTLGNCSMKYVTNADDTVTVSAGTWSKTYSNLAAAVEVEGPVNRV